MEQNAWVEEDQQFPHKLNAALVHLSQELSQLTLPKLDEESDPKSALFYTLLNCEHLVEDALLLFAYDNYVTHHQIHTPLYFQILLRRAIDLQESLLTVSISEGDDDVYTVSQDSDGIHSPIPLVTGSEQEEILSSSRMMGANFHPALTEEMEVPPLPPVGEGTTSSDSNSERESETNEVMHPPELTKLSMFTQKDSVFDLPFLADDNALIQTGLLSGVSRSG